MIFAAFPTQLASQYMLGNYEVVVVGNNKEGQLQLPLLPMAWDSDVDAILVIVRVAFLIVTSMRTRSRTFQRAKAKAALFFWGLLLFGRHDMHSHRRGMSRFGGSINCDFALWIRRTLCHSETLARL